MLISIIVPIYNVEKFLNQCVDSILKQQYKDMEIILVDDGSPDHCPYICDEYARADERIKVIHKKNGGLVSARVAGLKAANGDYIMYVDSDDWMGECAIEHIIKAIEQYNPEIIAFGLIRESKEGGKEYLNSFPAGFYRDKLAELIYQRMLYDPGKSFFTFGIHPSVCSKVFKRELLNKWQNKVDPSITMGEDLACSMPCLFDAKSIYIMDLSLYHYRVNEASITHTYNIWAFQNLKALLHCLYNNITDCHQNFIENQLNVYTTFMLLLILEDIFSNHNYRDSIKIIRENMNIDLRKKVRTAKIKNLDIKTYIKILMIKHAWWGLYYINIKRKLFIGL